MKTLKPLFLLILGFITVAGCHKDKLPVKDNPVDIVPVVTDAHKALVQSSNEFGIELFKEVNGAEQPGKNIFISPLSINMALGMAMNGARNDTRAAMEEALFVEGLTQAQINDTYRDILDNFPAIDNDVTLDIANSIWYKKEFEVLQDFIQTNEQHFDAVISPLDFNDPTSKNTINQWVEDATGGKIKDMIQSISPDHVMFLINAVYFKSDWTYQFDKTKNNQTPILSCRWLKCEC